MNVRVLDLLLYGQSLSPYSIPVANWPASTLSEVLDSFCLSYLALRSRSRENVPGHSM